MARNVENLIQLGCPKCGFHSCYEIRSYHPERYFNRNAPSGFVSRFIRKILGHREPNPDFILEDEYVEMHCRICKYTGKELPIDRRKEAENWKNEPPPPPPKKT